MSTYDRILPTTCQINCYMNYSSSSSFHFTNKTFTEKRIVEYARFRYVQVNLLHSSVSSMPRDISMRILLILFLLRSTQQNFFLHSSLENQTDPLQSLQEQTTTKPLLSNKVLIILIICLSLIVIAT